MKPLNAEVNIYFYSISVTIQEFHCLQQTLEAKKNFAFSEKPKFFKKELLAEKLIGLQF